MQVITAYVIYTVSILSYILVECVTANIVQKNSVSHFSCSESIKAENVKSSTLGLKTHLRLKRNKVKMIYHILLFTESFLLLLLLLQLRDWIDLSMGRRLKKMFPPMLIDILMHFVSLKGSIQETDSQWMYF